MNQPKVVVSAIIERIKDGKKQIFVQTRNKPQGSSSYLDMLEIPAGGIDPYENVYHALKREVKEETGLDVVRVVGEESGGVEENRLGEISMHFKPYLCQQVLSTNDGLPWYGFVFRCEVQGEIKMNLDEASDPRWISLEELDNFLKENPEKVFSLQYATLKKYLTEFLVRT